MNILKELKERKMEGIHRPAWLYSFKMERRESVFSPKKKSLDRTSLAEISTAETTADYHSKFLQIHSLIKCAGIGSLDFCRWQEILIKNI